MSFLLDALGKADDDRRRAEVPELRTYRHRKTSVLGRVARGLLLASLILGAFAGGYFARPWLETSWSPGKTVNPESAAPPSLESGTDPAVSAPASAAAPKGVAGLELEVISWSERPQARFAMINGAVVYEGDTLVSGERLLRIETDAVILQQSELTIRLTM